MTPALFYLYLHVIGAITLPYSTVIQEDDSGIVIIVVITDRFTSKPKDLSNATNITLILKRGDDNKSSYPASLVTDGTDGKVQYTLQDGDLSQPGNWGIQVSYMISGHQRYTSEDVFVVAPNFD